MNGVEEGWIEHGGGPNPVPGAVIEARYRDGGIDKRRSDEWSACWIHVPEPTNNDIIAYRVVTPAALSAIEGGGGALQASPSVRTEQADGGVVVPRELAAFLLGEGDLEGYWFGDTKDHPSGRRQAFWWRTALRACLPTPPATPIAGGFGSNRQGDLPTEHPETAVLVSLAECPPGLFWFGDTLGFKTEYGHSTGKDAGGGKVEWTITNYAEAYCVETGEYFWGGAHDLLAREELMVAPVSPGILRQQNEPKAAARRDEGAGQ